MRKIVKIATRKSPLALWQANFVKQELLKNDPTLRAELVPMSTSGDQFLQDTLAEKGGKGLFIKELEQALLNSEADLAVHSMKDLPVALTDDFVIAAVTQRASPFDAYISNRFETLSEIPAGGIVGTSSLRRVSQLKYQYPHLVFKPLRGNVQTRLAKLDAGEFDGIILAEAGLDRLGLAARIGQILMPEVCLPAVGQGALAIECRREDIELQHYLQLLHHPDTAHCVAAERAMNRALNGGCQVPVAGYAVLEGTQLWLRGLVGCSEGHQLLRSEQRGAITHATQIGEQVAQQLREQGADQLLMGTNRGS
jgi:hydroxymethylbilane synthase